MPVFQVYLGQRWAAVGLGELRGKGGTNEKVPSSQVLIIMFNDVLLQRSSFLTFPSVSSVSLCHQHKFVRLMRFLHQRGFSTRLLQPTAFTGTINVPDTKALRLNTNASFDRITWKQIVWNDKRKYDLVYLIVDKYSHF